MGLENLLDKGEQEKFILTDRRLAHLQILGRLNVDYCSTIKLNIVT
jgi:hypothetical protein